MASRSFWTGNFEEELSLPVSDRLRFTPPSPPPSPQAVLESGNIPEEVQRRRQDRHRTNHRFIVLPVKSGDKDHVPDEIERDPYLLDLYIKAISQGQEADTGIRVNIVGNFAQGKTSLAKRLIGETTDDVQSTNSVDIYRCQYANESKRILLSRKNNQEDDSEMVDRIVSIALSEKEKKFDSRRNNINPNFINNAEDDFLPPMPSDKIEMDKNHKRKSLNITDETDRKKVFVRGKRVHPNISIQTSPHDSKTRVVTKEELTLFEQRLESKRQESNAIGDIDIWDFGGQFIFYSTHTLFHSRRAIYILAFDLSLPLSENVIDMEFPGETANNKTMECFTKFWMNSIHSYVGTEDGSEPHVILVGTHKDQLNGDESAKQQFKDDYFENVRELFEDTSMIRHIHSVDFAVDNNDPDDDAFNEIREEIIHLCTDRLNTVQIPARWIPLERSLKQIRNEKIVTFDRIMELDSQNEFSLKDKEQVKLFLLYHHAKGTLFFFDEEPISTYVVLDAQYLIDAFKCIVTSERFCKKDPSFRHLWKRLLKEARLEKELVEKLWKNDTKNDFHKHKNELLMFLQKHLIISEVSNYDENTSESTGLGWFIVPSFLKDSFSENALQIFLNGKQQTSVRFVMRFYNSPVVQVVFYRLLAALIGRWPVLEVAIPEVKSLIYENLGVLRLDKFHAGIIERKIENIELRVVCLCHTGSVDDKIADHFRRFSESVVRNEFKKLRSAPLHEGPFTRCIRCNHEAHALNGSSFAMTLKDVANNKSVPCPDMISHDIFRDEVLCEWFQQDRVPEMIPDCQLNEKQLGKFAQLVGNNWELLGIELGLSQVEIQQISMDFQSCQMKIFKVLIEWKDKEKERATVNALVRAMKTAKKVYVDWDEIRNICEKINLERTQK
ncbi:uncharacterized protein LOC123546277 [Mercenaria mercenaria]|uniref:uncharacterized protein LOC123546277 n=1 Tax=Mercenaria mercenaria TaxID=6596 RepID=UPI00234E62A2|nr:uncharacterized protein LOC123546277 [Mercenaria mercenaria]